MQPTIQQSNITVLHQYDVSSDKNKIATCGFHALRNALVKTAGLDILENRDHYKKFKANIIKFLGNLAEKDLGVLHMLQTVTALRNNRFEDIEHQDEFSDTARRITIANCLYDESEPVKLTTGTHFLDFYKTIKSLRENKGISHTFVLGLNENNGEHHPDTNHFVTFQITRTDNNSYKIEVMDSEPSHEHNFKINEFIKQIVHPLVELDQNAFNKKITDGYMTSFDDDDLLDLKVLQKDSDQLPLMLHAHLQFLIEMRWIIYDDKKQTITLADNLSDEVKHALKESSLLKVKCDNINNEYLRAMYTQLRDQLNLIKKENSDPFKKPNPLPPKRVKLKSKKPTKKTTHQPTEQSKLPDSFRHLSHNDGALSDSLAEQYKNWHDDQLTVETFAYQKDERNIAIIRTTKDVDGKHINGLEASFDNQDDDNNTQITNAMTDLVELYILEVLSIEEIQQMHIQRKTQNGKQTFNLQIGIEQGLPTDLLTQSVSIDSKRLQQLLIQRCEMLQDCSNNMHYFKSLFIKQGPTFKSELVKVDSAGQRIKLPEDMSFNESPAAAM